MCWKMWRATRDVVRAVLQYVNYVSMRHNVRVYVCACHGGLVVHWYTLWGEWVCVRVGLCVCDTYARVLLCRWAPGFVCLLLDVRDCTCWFATPTVLDQAWSQCWPRLRSLPSTAGCGSAAGRQLWRVYDIERMCLCVDAHDGCRRGHSRAQQ